MTNNLPYIRFENSYLRYVFDSSGRIIEFTDARTGMNYVESGALFAYLLPQTDNNKAEPVAPSIVRRDGNEVVVSFSEPAATFRLTVQELDTNLRFTIAGCDSEKADYGRFIFAACVLREASDEFACTSVSLHIRCNTLEYPGQGLVAGALVDCRLDNTGASCALIGAPKGKLRDFIKSAMAHLTIEDFPINPKGGAYAVDTREAYGDYIIDHTTRSSEDLRDFDKWLEPILSAGILQVNFHQGALYRQSDFEFKKDIFPEGITDFRRKVTDRMHEKGLLACLHSYSSMIDKKSIFVTPIPHPDLEAMQVFTLAEAIGENDCSVMVLESTVGIPTAHSFGLWNSLTLAIDDELIVFSAIGENGFLQCERGSCGTKKAPHAKGAKVRHLKEAFGMFLSRIGSPLFFEVARRTAEAYNQGGFDAMYLDGLDFVRATIGSGGESGCLKGLEWYYAELFVWEVLKNIKKPALMEYSDMYPSIWYARSRNSAWDYPTRAYTHWHDLHIEGNGLTGPIPLLPHELGWFNMFPSMEIDGFPKNSDSYLPNWSVRHHYSDDVDYLGTKSVAYDAGISYISTLAKTREKFPVLGRYSRQIEPYSRLRTSQYFSQAVKDRIKQKKNFRLVNEGGIYGFERLERLYARPYSLHPGENSDRVVNPFGAQKPFVRLEAHFGGAPYDDAHAQVVARFDRGKPISEQALSFQFDPPINLSGREALGVWIKGNGSTEYLNIQLESPKNLSYYLTGVNEHIVPLSFEGWKYFSLCEENIGEYTSIEFKNNTAGPYKRYREYMTYKAVSDMRILLTGDGGDIYMSDIHAVPVIGDPIVNPGINIGGNNVRFNCELRPGEYLEYAPGEKSAIVYDPCGNAKEVDVIGVMGVLPHGESTIHVHGEASGDHRLTLHLLVTGERIFN